MADEYWFPWYPGHYERDAGHLDHVADSCYRRLIDAYMRGGEPIPKDPVRLMYITRTSPQQFQTIWPQIEGFFYVQDGFLHLKRCNIELDRQDTRRRFASEAGKRSAQKRAQQYQLLTNDRSTPVQQQLNDRSTSRATTGQDRTDIQIDKNLSGAKAPEFDLKKVIFTNCLNWLAQANGKDPNKYRSILGKWVSQYGEANVASAFVEAQRAAPVGDCVGYLQRILEKNNRSPRDIGI